MNRTTVWPSINPQTYTEQALPRSLNIWSTDLYSLCHILQGLEIFDCWKRDSKSLEYTRISNTSLHLNEFSTGEIVLHCEPEIYFLMNSLWPEGYIFPLVSFLPCLPDSRMFQKLNNRFLRRLMGRQVLGQRHTDYILAVIWIWD